MYSLLKAMEMTHAESSDEIVIKSLELICPQSHMVAGTNRSAGILYLK
jgi:hypothetical protein